jgi:hypothetical protein
MNSGNDSVQDSSPPFAAACCCTIAVVLPTGLCESSNALVPGEGYHVVIITGMRLNAKARLVEGNMGSTLEGGS